MSGSKQDEIVEDDYYLDLMDEILDGFPNNGPPQHPVRLSDHIFIGNQENADDVDLLRTIGVTHVLNCTASRTFDFTRSPYKPASGIVGFLMIPAEDFENYDIMQHLMDGIVFLDKAKVAKGIAFVHCTLGVNRSGALAAAYLMVDQKRKLLDVIRELKAKRSVILTNHGFRRQLVRFARCRGLLDPVTDEKVDFGKAKQSSPLPVKHCSEDESKILCNGHEESSERKQESSSVSKHIMSTNGYNSSYTANGHTTPYVNGRDLEIKNVVHIGDHHKFRSVYEDDDEDLHDTSPFTSSYSTPEFSIPVSYDSGSKSFIEDDLKFSVVDDFQRFSVPDDFNKYKLGDDLSKFNVSDEYKGDLEYTGIKYSPTIAPYSSKYYLPESPRYTPVPETPSRSYLSVKPKSSYEYSDQDLDDFETYGIDLPKTSRHTSRSVSLPRITGSNIQNGSYLAGMSAKTSSATSRIYANDFLNQPSQSDLDLDDFVNYNVDLPRPASVPRITSSTIPNASYSSGTYRRANLSTSKIYTNNVQPLEPLQSNLDDINIDLPRLSSVPRITSRTIPNCSYFSGTQTRVDLSPTRTYTNGFLNQPLHLNLDDVGKYTLDLPRPASVPRIRSSNVPNISYSSETRRRFDLSSDLDDLENDLEVPRPVMVPKIQGGRPASATSYLTGTHRRGSWAPSRTYTDDALYQLRPYVDKSTAWQNGSFVTPSSTYKPSVAPTSNVLNYRSTTLVSGTSKSYSRPQTNISTRSYPKRTFDDDLDDLDSDFTSDTYGLGKLETTQQVRTRVTAPAGRRMYSALTHRW